MNLTAAAEGAAEAAAPLHRRPPRPQIIIADEPTGNLDSKKSEEIVTLLKELNRKKKITVIVITHDPNVAKAADRTLLMHDGRIGK